MTSILVVDGSPVMRKKVIRSIRQAGFGDCEIREAGDGAQGLSEVLAHNPDLVLSDWNMPAMNGLEFLQAVRAESINIPFGFVTSESSAEQKGQAAAAGADFLLSRPFTAEDLASELSVVL